DRPSMVVISAPDAWASSMLHDLTALPFSSTVHAPHWAVSQPTWVPVSLRCSRSAWTSSVWGAASTVTALPLTLSGTCMVVSCVVSRGHHSEPCAPGEVLRGNPETGRARDRDSQFETAAAHAAPQ